jgi:hypothetical protein
MSAYWRACPALLVAGMISVAFAGDVLADVPPQHVVDDAEIQARIDGQFGQADADREAIRALLRRPEVREIAGAAGLDIERADAAAATLSDSQVRDLAQRAREADAEIGGDSVIIMSTTLLLLIIILILVL